MAKLICSKCDQEIHLGSPRNVSVLGVITHAACPKPACSKCHMLYPCECEEE